MASVLYALSHSILLTSSFYKGGNGLKSNLSRYYFSCIKISPFFKKSNLRKITQVVIAGAGFKL